MQLPSLPFFTLVSFACLRSSIVRGLSSIPSANASKPKPALSSSISAQRERLLAEPGVMKERATIIRAELLDPSSSTADQWMVNGNTEAQDVVTKLVHFQRHGQGFHNILGDVLRDSGITPDVHSSDPAVNPWLRPEIVDAPLTEMGKEQCRQQRPKASLLNPQLLIVSPLLRAIQTAKLSFADFYSGSSSSSTGSSKKTIPWVVHEGTREELGVLVCNKRRPLSNILEDFADLEFVPGMSEEDTLWNPSERETGASKSDRIYDFLVDFLMTRSETEIAVVGHSAWLFHMCNAVVDCGEDEDLLKWFMTSEIRSMRLTFETARPSIGEQE